MNECVSVYFLNIRVSQLRKRIQENAIAALDNLIVFYNYLLGLISFSHCQWDNWGFFACMYSCTYVCRGVNLYETLGDRYFNNVLICIAMGQSGSITYKWRWETQCQVSTPFSLG